MDVPAPVDPEELVHRATGLLRRLDLSAGDRVLTLLDDGPGSLAFGLACVLEGVVQVPLHTGMPPREVGEIVADASPQLAVVSPTDVGALPDGLDRHVLDRGGLTDHAPAAPRGSWPSTRPMAYTSGTTGRRKGVYVGVHDETWGEKVVRDEHDAFDRRHGDLHLVVSPLHHSGPFRFASVTWFTGGRVAVMPHFDAELLLASLRQLRPTSLFCVPTHLHRLLTLPDVAAGDLASLRLLAHAGAPCPTPLKERVLELAPDDAVWEFYGSTEGQFTACPPDVWRGAPGTVGRARPDHELAIRDPGDDGVGTVWVDAPAHARWEYWNDPQRTDEAWAGGAFTVGDLGRLDGDRRLFLHGRPGDLVISGGVNVYPAEVERPSSNTRRSAKPSCSASPTRSGANASWPWSSRGRTATRTPTTWVRIAGRASRRPRCPSASWSWRSCPGPRRARRSAPAWSSTSTCREQPVVSGRRGALLAAVAAHEPADPRERDSVRRTLALVRDLDDPFSESANPIHVTSSAIVVDGAGRVLLHRHRILGIWLQPGGHVEGRESPEEAAVREALEETGIPARHPGRRPLLLHVDVPPAPKPACDLHLDLRYLLEAPEGAEPDPPEDESQDVAWFAVHEAAGVSDPSVAAALRKLLA